MKTQWNFIYQKLMEEKRRREQQEKIAKEREQMIQKNKSYRSFLSQEINLNNKNELKKKLKSKR